MTPSIIGRFYVKFGNFYLRIASRFGIISLIAMSANSRPHVLNFIMWLMVSNRPYSFVASLTIFAPLVVYQTQLYCRTLTKTHVIGLLKL